MESTSDRQADRVQAPAAYVGGQSEAPRSAKVHPVHQGEVVTGDRAGRGSVPRSLRFPSGEDDAHAAALEADRQLASELGLTRPYAFPGPQFGTCPGVSEYGHGLTLTTVHLGCCARWDAARAIREAAS